MPDNVEIHHPSKRLRKARLAGDFTCVFFGRADRRVDLQGYLYDRGGRRYQGMRIQYCQSAVSPRRKFWMLQFQVEPGHYTLRVFHGTDDSKPHLDIVEHFEIEPPDRPGFSISYPTAEYNPIPSEFGASGPGVANGTVSGSVSNVSESTCDPAFPPPNWGLSMSVDGFPTDGTTCTFSATETGCQGAPLYASQGGLTFFSALDPPPPPPPP
jgi:hypothetical protein